MALFCHIFQSDIAKNKFLFPMMSYTQYIIVFLSQNAHRAGRIKIYSNDTNIILNMIDLFHNQLYNCLLMTTE